MNYTIDTPTNTSAQKVQSQLTEKVAIQIENFDTQVIYENLVINQDILDHHHFAFLWKLGDAPRMSYQDQASIIQKYLGKTVAITLKDTPSALQVNFKGIITQIQINDSDGGSKGFTITGKSSTILIDDMPQSQTHLNQTLKNIITTTTADAPQDLLPTTNINPIHTTPIPYTVQYNETDFQFLQRMAVRYGEWFFYDGEHLVFGDTLQYDAQLTSGVNLHNFSISSSIIPQKTSFNAYDPQQATSIEKQQLTYQNNTKSQVAQDAIKNADALYQRSNKNKQYIAHATNSQELEHIQQHYQQAQEARAITYSGMSKLPLKIGGLVSITKDNVESLFLVTKAIHNSNLFGHYQCYFESIPYDVKVPHYTNPFLTRTGESQPAKVTDNNDPQGMGRVIVEFHWGHKTDWIAMIQPHGGSNKGFYFIPEIGEEVLVGFQSNNIEKPYIIGTTYNGQQLSGYGGTPNNDLKVIQTRSGHIIKLDDTDAAENITITDKNGNQIYLDTANSSITITAPENMTLNAKNIDINAENMQVNIEEDLNFNIGKNKTEQIGETLSISSATKIEEVAKDMSLYVEQSLTQTSGEAIIETNQGDIIIQGAGVAALQGGADVKISKG